MSPEASLQVPAGLVLDLDGTLVDTTYLHTLCWWQALQQFDLYTTMARVHRAVGLASTPLLDYVVGTGRGHRPDEAILAAHDALFATWRSSVQALPGARPLLDWCRDQGVTVMIASSSQRKDVEAMMRVLGDPDLDVVSTGDDVEEGKPSPDVAAHALDLAGLEPHDAMMVGDSVWDVAVAGKLPMQSIGLTCGGTSAAELDKAGATVTFADPWHLLHALQASAG